MYLNFQSLAVQAIGRWRNNFPGGISSAMNVGLGGSPKRMGSILRRSHTTI
jgi:hypothetical protein